MQNSVGPLYGPILLAVCINLILYGVLLSQAYDYHIQYRKTDPRLNKYLIIYVVLLETAHTALTIDFIYEPLINKFGDHQKIQIYPRTLCAIVAVMGAVTLPIQTFIAWRIVRLQRSFWIGGVICFLAVISFAGSMLSVAQIPLHEQFSQKRSLTFSAALWLTPGAVADVLIAGSLSWSLCKRKTGLPSTDAVVSRIIRLTLQTGIVTSVAALLNLITLVTLPLGNSVNFVFNVTLMKTYANFLLATLNARSSWSDELQNINFSILFEDLHLLPPPMPINFGDDNPAKLFVNQDRKQDTMDSPTQTDIQSPQATRLSRSLDITNYCSENGVTPA